MLLFLLFMTACSAKSVSYFDISMTGGSGKAHIESPVEVTKDTGATFAKLVWSSENYDYVIADGIRYENENPGGRSTFTIPVKNTDEPFTIIADTVAMSKPHEIEYTITWEKEHESGAVKTDDAENAADVEDRSEEESDAGAFGSRPDGYDAPVIPGLEKTGSIEIKNARGFEISKLKEYRLISIYGVGEYLLVPEGEDVPQVPENVTVLKQPLDKCYLVSTSAMDLVRGTGALDSVAFSSLEADKWSIPEASALMKEGKMKYAGKYRSPDYELLLSQGCDLAVENTMIFHDPQVKEKLEELGIPVIIETSSYEKDALARLEWVKLYGTLFTKEDEARACFENVKQAFEKVEMSAKMPKEEEKTTAFFSVSATGLINVRKPDDYIAGLIETAGSVYVPSKECFKDGGTGTANMQPEDFYIAAKDADVLIYNSTIAGTIGSVEELIDKNAIFADFKAVKDGNVYCLTDDFFQKTTAAADLLLDIEALCKGEERDFVFLKKLR